MTRGATLLEPIIAAMTPEDDSDVQAALDDSTSRHDDAYWARFVAAPFTWRRYSEWWVARRWVVPRDVRRH